MIIGWAVLIASLVVYYFVAGIPWSHQLGVCIYVMAGLVVSSLGSGVRWKRLLLDWLPLSLVLFGYGILRGYAVAHPVGPLRQAPGLVRHPRVGFGVDPTVQLQRWLYHPGCTSGITWCGPVT